MRLNERYCSYIDDDKDFQESRSLARILETIHGAMNKPYPKDWPCYRGPWALETMGGAGGQTIVGVASTATHGGDINSSAIGELVVALHLIAPDGQEYWIERTRIHPEVAEFKLFDENKLRDVYRVGDPTAPGGAQRKRPVIYRRDDDLMNAVLVSCGRMGVIYSVVLRTVLQYGLKEETVKGDWNEVKKWIANPMDPKNKNLFADPYRFVRVDVNLYPEAEIDWEATAWSFGALALLGPLALTAGGVFAFKQGGYTTWQVTRRKVSLNATVHTDTSGASWFYGRNERGGANAGKTAALGADPKDPGAWSPCQSSTFLQDVITQAINRLSDIRHDALTAAAIAAAAMSVPFASAFAAVAFRIATGVVVFTQYCIHLLHEVRDVVPATSYAGDYICAVLNLLSQMRAHGIVQLMYAAAQEDQHRTTEKATTAISYAVMDEHDYLNVGCVAPGDTIELFFDATKPDFVSFVDYLLEQVQLLADQGKGLAGYLSMRFMTESPAFLAMQRWPRTVSMEIAGLSKASGAADLMQKVEEESRKRGAILHWGQRNGRVQADIEAKFVMAKWRQALSDLSEHGRLANFSTEFTRVKGLEITDPRLYALTTSLDEGCEHETTRVHYDGFNNPPSTKLALVHRFESGGGTTIDLPDLRGDIDIPFGRGRSTIELHATRTLNNNKYMAPTLTRPLRGFGTGDTWEFMLPTYARAIGGVVRWYADINLFSQRISNALRVSEVELSATSGTGWILRNAATGDVSFPGLASAQPLPTQPVFNTDWQFYTATAAQGSVPPTLAVRFKIVC